jgi:signal transduction histidine kinase
MMSNKEPEAALAEIKEIQVGVGCQYDELREYVRSLAWADQSETSFDHPDLNAQFHVQAAFVAPGKVVEHIMQIVLEGIRNILRHGLARSGSINVQQLTGTINIKIDDDGIGFRVAVRPPWTIASRVAELGGRLAVDAHLKICLPTVQA